MIFVTALLALHMLPHISSVKVVIDGTIDFGPNWNFEHNSRPTNDIQPRKIIIDNQNVLRNSDNVKTEAKKQGNNADIKVNKDTEKKIERTATWDDSDEELDDEKEFEVTRLYKTNHNTALFKKPHKIKYDTEVVQFVDHIKNESVKMFDKVRKKIQDDKLIEKISELKQRYVNKFGTFVNETKHHMIRTSLGHQKVIMNTINYSNKVISHLVNRFKIDVKDTPTSGLKASNIFEEHKNYLRNNAYTDACNMLGICRSGNEFTDRINSLILDILLHNDTTVVAATKPLFKLLKEMNFSRIMDNDTIEAFNQSLSVVEEYEAFELRFWLMTNNMIIDNRHKPFLEDEPDSEFVTAITALFHVMDRFDKKIIIESDVWNKLEEDLNLSLDNNAANIEDVYKPFLDRVHNDIEELEERVVNDIKNSTRLYMVYKSLRTNPSYVYYHPFVNSLF